MLIFLNLRRFQHFWKMFNGFSTDQVPETEVRIAEWVVELSTKSIGLEFIFHLL